MEYLKRTQLPLEVCPPSNIYLGVYPSIFQHSLPHLLEYGLRITINSDDPPMFNTTLTGEYLACQETFGWGPETLHQLVSNAVDVSLLPESDRAVIRRIIHIDSSGPGR